MYHHHQCYRLTDLISTVTFKNAVLCKYLGLLGLPKKVFINSFCCASVQCSGGCVCSAIMKLNFDIFVMYRNE